MAFFEIETNDSLYTVAATLLLFITALIIVITCSSYLIGEKWNQNHSLQIPESGVTMAIGIFIGGLMRLCSLGSDSPVVSNLVAFAPPLFFLGFLPPIMFNEGHHLDTTMFFAYLTPILIFVFIGTAVSTIIVAAMLHYSYLVGIAHEISFAESVAFGGLISATDPIAVLAAFSRLKVEPTLFFLVFGEAALNDAVSLTIFTIASKFVKEEQQLSAIGEGFVQFVIIVVASTIIGVLCGLGMAYALKTAAMRKTRVLELALYGTLIYFPYMLGQVTGMSGIVSILVAGITAKHYAFDNLSSDEERDLAEFLFRLFAFLADNATFLYLGFAVFSVKIGETWNPSFILWAFFACIVARAGAVYGLSGVINLTANCTSGLRIGWRTQTVMFFAGLRGAVAFAAATNFPDELGNRQLIVTTTMAIVIIFTFIMAIWTVPLIRVLKIPYNVDYRTVRLPELNKFYKWCGSLDQRLKPIFKRKVAAGELVEVGIVSLHRPRLHSGLNEEMAMAALRGITEYPEEEFPLEPFDQDHTMHVGTGDVEWGMGIPSVSEAEEEGMAATPPAAGSVEGFQHGPQPALAPAGAPAPAEAAGSAHEDTLQEWIEQSIYDFGGPVSPRQPAAVDVVTHASMHRPHNQPRHSSQHRRRSSSTGVHPPPESQEHLQVPISSQHRDVRLSSQQQEVPHASHHRQVPMSSQHRQVPMSSQHRQVPLSSQHRQVPLSSQHRRPSHVSKVL